MLSLDDPAWKTYKGGRRELYDASRPLRQLVSGESSAPIFEELWDALHHQGDVDSASYAAIPYLVDFARRSFRLDWDIFGLIAVIELERPHNPQPPPELADDYYRTIQDLPVIICSHPYREWDDLSTRALVSCIALAQGQRLLARLYLEMTREAAAKWLNQELGGFRE